MKKILTAWLQRHPFSSSPAEKENVHPPLFLPVISQSRNRHPLLFFERVITRDTMHANPDILDGNAISGRRRGEGEGGQIPRWWIRLKNGLLEGDPEHPAKRIDDGGRPHSPAAQALCDFLITGEEAPLSSPPTSNSKSASFHIASLISLRPISWWARDHARLPSFP